MRKLLLTGVFATTLILGGCATPFPVGGLYTDLNLPIAATSNAGSTSKIGKASCKSYLALIATGDCSLEAAKASAGISEVVHVDWKANNILGIIGNYELTVYGK